MSRFVLRTLNTLAALLRRGARASARDKLISAHIREATAKADRR